MLSEIFGDEGAVVPFSDSEEEGGSESKAKGQRGTRDFGLVDPVGLLGKAPYRRMVKQVRAWPCRTAFTGPLADPLV